MHHEYLLRLRQLTNTNLSLAGVRLCLTCEPGVQFNEEGYDVIML